MSMRALEPKQREQIERAAALLAGLDNLLFVTGAGISADSGLPTYRGVGGLYDEVETEEGLPIEVCLSGPMFRRDPACTWKYMREIERACRGAQPNLAHARLAELERARERVWVLTQNVDGLHLAAGSTQVIEIHGNLHSLRCTACTWAERITDFAGFEARFGDQPVPSCPGCGAPIRPDVVLFEEMLPSAAISTLQRELGRGFDAVISIGTSGMFPYVVQPVLEAHAAGRPTLDINPGTSSVSRFVDVHIELGAAAAMDALVDALGS